MQLVISDLAGERGGETIFDGVSFSLSNGEALVVSGPNGSGKSTLLRIIAGLLEPEAGTVALEGAVKDFASVAAASHYLGHHNAMKPVLSVTENLDFWRTYNGEAWLTPTEALEVVELEEIGHLPFGYLSTGQRRRVAIARLLVSARPIWLLDEPTSGLDRRSEQRFSELMRDHLGDGGMIIAATHLPLGLEGAGELVMGG